ncbi:MAG: PAS domain-containing sensor histidine kinase [Alphaproteobacteria bacterium]|nr:PAS domain-containing sensor histidine kinase [Alphaproteobacteria bacterium]
MNASLFDNPTRKGEKISDPDLLAASYHEKEFGLFNSVFHEVSNAIAIISRDRDDQFPVILDINHHFELITGYPLDEIYGRSLYDFLAQTRSGSNRHVIEQALASRQAAILFCPWINRNGRILDIDMTIRPFSSDDKGSRFICVLRENNDSNYFRDKAAREIKQSLLAAMHHDFKTPLNGILGYSEVIMTEMLGPIGQESYKNCAHDIHGAGLDLLRLIDNLLELKELETTEFDLQEQAFPVADMIGSCLDKISTEAEKGDVIISYHVTPEEINLFGDKSRLQQVIHSLLTNALKFTPAGGRITVSACRDSNGCCLISCTDDGVGMSSQQLAKIFCYDTHLSDIYSTPTTGIGFGLSYVKQLVEKHGGTVSVISSLGNGTTVTLYLPAERLVKAENPC